MGACFAFYIIRTLLEPGRPKAKFVPSSFDWSTFQHHHPPSSIKPLPEAKASTLRQVQAKPKDFQHCAEEKSRRKAVRDAFVRSYASYKEFAWMKDELAPLTGTGKNTFGGWAATLVDSLDTMWIMGLKDDFAEASDAMAALDWASTEDGAVNLFETTIRHLGGLLSAYELSREDALLQKAIELGEMLYVAFDTPNRMPGFWLNFQEAQDGKQVAGTHDPSASPTSLCLEFTRLSQLSGDPKFYDATDRVTRFLERVQETTRMPGMWPLAINFQQETADDVTFSLGALADSLYEYLPKMSALLGGIDPSYEAMYRRATEVIIENLLFRPMLPGKEDILFAGDVHILWDKDDQKELTPESQHLTCFVGGMFALGGKIYGIEEHVSIGERLARGCAWAYGAFPAGVMPEIFNMIPCDSLDGCEWDEARWEREGDARLTKGFSNARDPRYILRPEAIESVFIMYRITGRAEWQDMAWEMFQSIMKATTTKYANAAIEDVTAAEPVRIDSMEVRVYLS